MNPLARLVQGCDSVVAVNFQNCYFCLAATECIDLPLVRRLHTDRRLRNEAVQFLTFLRV